MSNYPHNPHNPNNPPSGYPYNPPPPSQPPYNGAPPTQPPYNGAPPSQPPYNAPPPSQQPYNNAPYGGAPPSQSYPSAPYGGAPPSQSYPSAPYGGHPSGPPPPNQPSPYSAPPQPYGGYPPYGSPFSAPAPSAFPPGTDPDVIANFQMADLDGSGFIDDKEFHRVLSLYHAGFGMRTVHLLMYLFTNSNLRKIGPKEFTQIFYSLKSWRGMFERFDRDKSGKIDANELREALLALGFQVSPPILDLLLSKFDKTGGKNMAFEYDNFIECCLTVKGLTDKFKEKDTSLTGSATFTYEAFMLTVLPFIIA